MQTSSGPSTGAGSLSDLTVGKQVTAFGAAATDGSLNATVVFVGNDRGPGGGRGGPGGDRGPAPCGTGDGQNTAPPSDPAQAPATGNN